MQSAKSFAIVVAAAVFAAAAATAHANVSEYVLPRGLTAIDGMTATTTGLWFGYERGRTSGLAEMSVRGRLRLHPSPIPIGPPLVATPDGAVWALTLNHAIVRFTVMGGFQTFMQPTPSRLATAVVQGAPSAPSISSNQAINGLAPGSGNSMWYSEELGLGHVEPSGVIEEYPFPPLAEEEEVTLYGTRFSGPFGLTEGGAITDDPMSGVWFLGTTPPCDVIGRISLAGGSVGFSTIEAQPPLLCGARDKLQEEILSGPGGDVWYAEPGVVYAIEPRTFHTTRFILPPSGEQVTDMTNGPDHNVWFVGRTVLGGPRRPRIRYYIGRLTPKGVASYFPLPAAPEGEEPLPLGEIATGPDGAVWALTPHGLLRVSLNTPAFSTPLAGVSFISHPRAALAPPPPVPISLVESTVDENKLDAQVAVPLIKAADDALLVVKVAVAISEPELVPGLFLPEADFGTLDDAASFAAEREIERLADDPPDPHFERIARPIPIALHPPHRVRGFPPTVVASWSRAIRSDAAAAADLGAMIPSIERLEGAAEAGSCSWVRRQAAAVHRFAAAAHTEVGIEMSTARKTLRLLARAQLGQGTVTTSEFEQAQAEIAARGLPQSTREALERAGVSAAEIEHVTAEALSQPARTMPISDTVVPDTSHLSTLVTGLQGLARVAARPVRCPT